MNFNPHDNVTSDGTLIAVGMAVIDYDRNLRWVKDDACSPILCESNYCDGDHWFTVENAEGQPTGRFNGDRLRAYVPSGTRQQGDQA